MNRVKTNFSFAVLLTVFSFGVFISLMGESRADSFYKSSHVSTFIVGDVVEVTSAEIKVNEVYNVIFSGKNIGFTTYIKVIPEIGKHKYEVLLVTDRGTTFASVNHGEVETRKPDHVHELMNGWTVNVPKVDYFYVVVVDTFNGKRNTVGTVKMLVE